MVVDFPPSLRNLVEGYFAYLDGGYQGTLPPFRYPFLHASCSPISPTMLSYISSLVMRDVAIVRVQQVGHGCPQLHD